VYSTHLKINEAQTATDFFTLNLKVPHFTPVSSSTQNRN
jgi:hypothetical protein